jgi:regulator of sigma E protease
MLLTIVASVFVFGLLIFFHEFGHFIIAKIVGIKVHEFSLGFGPKLLALPRGETSYNLRLLPLGGYVRMAGMEPNEELDEADVERGFNKKTVSQRVAVIFAGPLLNFVLAALLFSILIASAAYRSRWSRMLSRVIRRKRQALFPVIRS